MKNKQKKLSLNNQEDEDGFSLNPYDVFINYSTKENYDFDTIENSTISVSGSEEFTMISSNEKQNTNNAAPYPNHEKIINKKQLITT